MIQDIINILPGIVIILLVFTLYFLTSAINIYGGKIGKSLNIIGLGIFGLALKELSYFISTVSDYTFLEKFYSNKSLVQTSNYILNIIIFALLTYGFYEMSKVFETKNNK